MAFEVFKPLADAIMGNLIGWTGISNTIIGELKAPILAALTVKLMWQGFSAMRGGGGNVLLDVVFSNVRILVVWWGALTAGAYSANVQDVVIALRNDLSGLFVPGATDGYVALDQMMTSATDALSTIFTWGDSHWSFIPPNSSGLVAIICGCIMAGCMTIFGIVACANLLFVDLSLALLFAVGPLFIACFAFQATASFFSSWLSATLKYVFTAVTITAIASMAIAIMVGYATKLQATTDTLEFLTTTCAAVGASGVLIFFAGRAASVASDIVGGIAINAMSNSAVAGAVTRYISSAGSGTANAAAYGAGVAASTSAGRAIASSPLGSAVSSMVSRGSDIAAGLSSSSMGAAYQAGRGGSISAGPPAPPPSPSSRPLGTPAGTRST